MAPDLSPAELLREWRELMDRAASTAGAVAPDVLRDVLERERALQREIVGRVLAPTDAVFDLLEQSGEALRQQAVALEEAGSALSQAAALMKGQAELFERSIATLRGPTELAKTVSGVPRRPRKKPAS